MDLAPDCSVTEASALQQLLERWAAYDNRCLNHRIVAQLPWKQMSKTIFLPCSNFSLSVTCLLFRILFFFLDFFSCSCLILASFGSRNVFSVFFSEMLTHVTLLLSAFLQLHLQFELFLLLAFCERATRSPSPALSLGILCKSICICMCGKQLGIGALYIKNVLLLSCFPHYLPGHITKITHSWQMNLALLFTRYVKVLFAIWFQALLVKVLQAVIRERFFHNF